MDKKTIKRIVIFLGLLFVSTASGFVFGRVMRGVQGSGVDFSAFKAAALALAKAWTPVVYVTVSIVLFLLSLAALLRSRREAALWDGDDEEVIDRIEQRLYIPNILSGTMLILNFLFFSIAVYLDHAVLACELCFAGNFVWILGINGGMLHLEKKLNPEKRGNFLDFHFAKQWEQSCDEAQKVILYQAGYRAFVVTNMACIFAWLIAFVGMILFGTGILALVLICAVWLSAVLTYLFVGKKLER